MIVADVESFDGALRERSGSLCELCGAGDDLGAMEVAGAVVLSEETAALVCEACRGQIAEPATIDANHWHCLNESAWSEVPAIQVLAWRLLSQLKAEAWAGDLLEQLYLDDDTIAWAKAGMASEEDADNGPKTVDSNGTELLEGDAVTIIKDLDVKGTTFVAKRGTVVKNVHLTTNPEHVEGRVSGSRIVLKTCFLRKVT